MKEAIIFVTRNRAFSIILCVTLCLVFVGEILSLMLMNAVKKGEEDAYIYNGFALYIESATGGLSDSDYDFLEQIDHVTGVGGHFSEITVTPVDTKNVKDHIGADVSDEHMEYSDKMTIVAMMDLKNYDIFRREKHVSILKGKFPDKDGILIESRYAEENNIEVGENVEFATFGCNVSLQVVGIYLVDSDFEVLETNDIADNVYIYSPYNVIYMEYEYALDIFEEITDTREVGCDIYIDRPENIEYVASTIKNKFGDEVNIYDNTTDYMENECALVGILGNIAQMIQISVLISGTILLLIVISFVYDKVKHDSGIYLMLGDKRNRVTFRTIFIFVVYCFFGICISVLCLFIFQDFIIDVINNSIYMYATSGSNGYGSRYIIPNIGMGFYIQLDKACLFNWNNGKKLILLLLYGIVVSSILPIISTIKAKPKELLGIGGH